MRKLIIISLLAVRALFFSQTQKTGIPGDLYKSFVVTCFKQENYRIYLPQAFSFSERRNYCRIRMDTE